VKENKKLYAKLTKPHNFLDMV